MNAKSKQRIESKERILNVACRLFKKNGYSATGIDLIMGEAGLTAGGFYAHFRSKTDLLEQAIEHSMKHSRQLLLKDTQHLSGEEKVKAVMNRYISAGHRDLAEKGCILPALAAEIPRGTKKANQLVSYYIRKWADEISQHMPHENALALISKAVGAVLLSRMVKNSELSDEILRAARK
jgi:TetR/AcrR family transcriptional repressor of nem operon